MNSMLYPKAKEAAASTEAAQPLHVLLVEDYPGNILVATTFLEMLGHTYEVASTGQEALDHMKRDDFHCVLMDVKMPVMDGYRATELLRAWEKEQARPRLPIIGMTACAMVGDKTRCLEAGMDDYISKPFQHCDLADKLTALSA